MTDRPILFSAPMVRALLAGTKTQTRRVFKGIEDKGDRGFHVFGSGGGIFGVTEDEVPSYAVNYLRIHPGDRLYVRETLECANGEAVGYPADKRWLPNEPWIWERQSIPSIHMPRRLSRITLNVTDVRVERLQDISEEDAKAEGIVLGDDGYWGPSSRGAGTIVADNPTEAYMELWNAINGPGAWDTNPWVAAYTFSVALGNIDQIGRAA